MILDDSINKHSHITDCDRVDIDDFINDSIKLVIALTATELKLCDSINDLIKLVIALTVTELTLGDT